jgi:hypothetical protein
MAQQQPIINLEWIDQEVRQYRAELIAAQQRINSQDEEIRELLRHIEDLEGRLAGLNTQLSRVDVLERSLDQYKEEIRLLVQQQEDVYQQDRREAARIKLIEQDNANRSLNELRKSFAALTHLEEELELHAAEDRRLNEAHLALRQKALDLEKRIDTDLRAIPYLQEQRARDARHIAQLQEQATTLLKSVDGLTNRMLVVEEMSVRNRQNVEDLITIRAELQQQQRRFLEDMQMVDQERQRQQDQWAEDEGARGQRMKEFAEQVRLFTEQYQKIKSTLAGLESLGERLQREQHEVAELQRLGEERQRSKMEEWESQAEKRWQREKLLWEQQWHDHDRRNVEQLERIVAVEELSGDNEQQVSSLWDVMVDDLRLQSDTLQNRTIRVAEQVETRRSRKHK